MGGSRGGATVWIDGRRLRRHLGRRRALVALVLGAALLAQACTGDDTEAGDEPSPDALSSGHELVLYEDERLRFLYPAGWDVEVSDGADERVFLEQPLEGDDGFPAAFITTSWPVLGADSLEFVRGHLGADPDRDEISELDEHAVDLAGADEAIVQRFVATDGVPGTDEAVPYPSVFVATSSGRTFSASVGIRDAAQLPADEYFDVFLDSLAFGAAAPPTADGGGSVLRPDGARLEVVVPEDWTFEIGATWVEALAPDDEMRVRSSANPVEDDVMHALAASAVDAGRSVEPAVIAGAREALRFDLAGDDDDDPTVSFAAITDDGETLVTLTLIGGTSELPSGTRESIIDSLRIGDAVGTSEADEDR